MRLPIKTLAAASSMLVSVAMADLAATDSGVFSPEPRALGDTIQAFPSGPVLASSIYNTSRTADAAGVFAGVARTPAHNIGTQRILWLCYRNANALPIDQKTVGGRTWADLLGQRADEIRAYYAQVSGGKLDLQIDILDVPLNPRADGSMWTTGTAQDTVVPTLGANISNYQFVGNFFADTTLITDPNVGSGSAGLGTGPTSGSGHAETWLNYTVPDTIIHELGHNLGYSHARSFSSPTTAYVYDYAARAYVTTAGFGTGVVQNVPIGTGYVEYGHPFSVMGAYPEDSGLKPRQKSQNGWLEKKHFAGVNTLAAQAPGGVLNLKVYDDMTDRQSVTNGLSGTSLAYGVKNAYANVAYNATILRPGEHFDGTLGRWIADAQTIDLYYRSHTEAAPGFGVPGTPASVVVDLNGVYMGRLRPGEVLIEKDFSQSLATTFDPVANAAATPLNPGRYRPTWYKIEYIDNGIDTTGHFANLRVTVLSGAQLVGKLWDADGATAGAQDGSGTWNSADTRWRDVRTATDNGAWTPDEDAVFGSASATAGTVTLSGAISAGSLAFRPTAAGTYTLVDDAGTTGRDTLTLGAGGLVAEESARIDADIALGYDQIWSISNTKTVEITGDLAQNAHTLMKMGQGTLLISTARTWSGTISVIEGPVTQTATQTFSGSGNLSFGDAGEYNINGGSLILANGKTVSGSWGLIRMNAGGSASAQEIKFLGAGTIAPDLLLAAGDHYVDTAGNGRLSGHISGSGNLVKTGAGTLYFDNTNDFTGSITLNAGTLVLSSWDATHAANDLILNANTLQLDEELANDTAVIGNLSGTAGSIITAVNSGSLTRRTLGVTQSVDGTFAGVIRNGTGGQVIGFTKAGAAALTLSGANTYTAATTVSAGTLRAAVGNMSAFGVNSAASVASGATLDLNGNNLTLGSIAGAGAVTLGAGTVTLGADNTSTSFSGAISGTGGLVKNGVGTLTLSGANTYSGVTRVNSGALRLDYAATGATTGRISGASALELAGGEVTFVGATGVASSAAFASTTVSGGTSVLRIVQNGATGLDVNLGAITRTAGTLDFSGITGATPGARFITSTGSAGAMLPGGAWTTVNGVDWAAKDATNTYVVAYTNYLDIPTGTGSILNSPTVNIRITDGIDGAVTLGATSVSVNSILMGASAHDGLLETAGKSLTVGAIASASTARALTLGAAPGDGTLTGTGGQLLLLNNAAASPLTLNTRITDAGSPLALTVSGGVNAGTVTLAADNTYTGPTAVINGATLILGSGATSGNAGTGAISLDSGTHLKVSRSDTFTLTNTVSGNGDLTQSGSGTLVLTADNTYTGSTRVATGTLRIGDGGTTGSAGSGAFLIDSGATLEFRRSTPALTIANSLSGAGHLVQSGSGKITLTALNSGFTGDITVASGTLAASADTALGSASAFGSGTNDITVAAGATLAYDTRRAAGYHTGAVRLLGGTLAVNGQDNTIAAGNTVTLDTAASSISGTGQWRMRSAATLRETAAASGSTVSVSTLTLTGSTAGDYTFDVEKGASAVDLTVSSAITGETGAEALAKTGAGTLKLSGDNTYGGTTTVSAGKLIVSGDTNLGAGRLVLGSATLALTNEGLRKTLISGNSLSTAAANGTAITTDLSLLHNTTGNTLGSNTTAAFTGKIWLTAGQWSFGENFDDAAYLKIDSTVVLNDPVWNTPTTGTITFASDGWHDIDLRVWNGGGGTGGVGTWGTAGIGVGIKTGASSTSASAYTKFAYGALGTSLVSTGDITIDNAVLLSGAAIVDTSALLGGSALLLTGDISGTGSLTKTGAATLTLSGANTYTGATTVSTGTLSLGSATAFGGKSSLAIAAGATFDAAGYDFETSALTGAGAVSLGSATLTANQSASTSFTGVISGSGNLTKSGSGNLTLSGKNTYTGATTIAAGTLRLDFAGTPAGAVIAPASALTLGGGTLEVAGSATLANTQTFASTRLTTDTSATVSLTSAGASLTLDLGAFTRTSAGSVDFILDAAPDTNRILISGYAPGARLGDWATVNGGSAFAGLDATGTHLVAITGLFTAVDVHGGGSRTHVIPNTPAGDVRIIQGGTALTPVTLATTTTSVNSLVVTASDAATVDFAAGQSLVITGTGATIENGSGAGGLTLGTVAGRGTLTAGAGVTRLTLTNSSPVSALVVNTAITDNGAALAVAQSGPGSLTLNAVNTYTGDTTIGSGAFSIGAAGSLGSGNYAGAIANSGSLVFASSADQTLSGIISGTGSLVKTAGSGTLTLSGANTYSGGTRVESGTLVIGSTGAIGSGSIAIKSAATLALNSPITVQLLGSALIEGAVHVNAGTLRMGPAAAFTDTGSLDISSGSTFDAADLTITIPTLTGAGTLAMGAGNITLVSGGFDGVISGTGSLSKSGSATMTLTGVNTYSGTTNIAAGTLRIGGAGTLGSGTYATAITDNGILDYASSANQTLSGVISGSGSIIKSGSGTLTLSGANRYSGSTTINAGTVKVGNINAFGTFQTGSPAGQVIVNAGGTVDFNGVGDATYGYTISGTGSAGTGALINTGAAITNSKKQMSNLRLAADASIGGTGNYALIASGYNPTTLDLGGFTLTKAGANTVSLATTTATAGSINISSGTIGLVNGACNLAQVSMALANTAGASFTLNNNSVSLGSLSGGGASGGNITLGSATLTVGALNTSTAYAGIISGTGGSLVKTGSGSLTLTGTNTYTGTTSINSGTVTLSGTGSLGTGAISLNGSLVVNRTANLTLAAGISGTGSISNTGTGTLTLSGANTYTGLTTVSAGTVRLASASAFGGGGAVSVASGATFDTAGASVSVGSLAGAGAFAQGAGTTTLSGASDGTFSGAITGTGGLIKSGSATQTLSGVNTYTGATSVSGGALLVDGSITSAVSVAAGATFGGAGSTTRSLTFADSSTLAVNTSSAFLASGGVTLTGALNVTFLTPPPKGDLTVLRYGSGFSGNLDLVHASGVRAKFTRDTANAAIVATINALNSTWNTDSGTWDANVTANWINGYDNLFANGDAVTFTNRAVPATVTLAGTLMPADITVDTAGHYTFAGTGHIAGTTTLLKTGTGTLSIATANTYTGVTTINGGTLEILDGGAIAGDIVDNATLTFANTGAVTHAGLISGTGALVKSGAGTLTLSAANTYAGTTTINGGTVILTGAGTLGAGAITQNGALVIDRSADLTIASSISGSGSLTHSGSATTTLTGTNTYTGLTTVSAGTLRLASASAFGGGGSLDIASGATFDAAGASVTIGSLSGSGTLAQGAGTTTLVASTNTTFSGAITGTGGLVKSGSGATALTGVSTYTGATSVLGGTLLVDGTLASSVTVASGASFGGTGSTSGSLVLGDASTLLVNTSTAFLASGGVTLNGSLNVTFLSNPPKGATTLLRYGSGFSGDLSLIHAAGVRATFTQDIAQSAIMANITALVSQWNTDSGTWDTGVSTNWYNGYDSRFSSGDSVTFGTRAVPAVVTLSGRLTPSDITVDTTGHYTFTGSGYIDGTTTLLKTGSGTLTVATANTYTGVTTINGGTLEIVDGGAITGAIVNNATLAFITTGALTHTGSVSGTGSLMKSGAGSLTLSAANTYSGATTLANGTLVLTESGTLGTGDLINSGTFVIQRTADLTVDSAIRGTGALVHSGSGTTTLAGLSSYTGDTSVTAGTLRLGAAFTGHGALAISSGATFDAAGQNITVSGLSGSGALVLGAGTATVDTASNAIFAGNISGAGSLTKSGSGRLTLSGVNTYTGATAVNAGILAVNLGAFATDAFSIASGASLELGASATPATLDAAVSGAGSVSFTGGGTTTVGTRFAMSGPVSVTSGHTLNLGVGNTVTAESITVYTGATLKGSGQFTGDLRILGGRFAPGNSPGILNITGDYVQSGGTLDVELGGATPGAYDQVRYSGTARLSGGATLALKPFGGFTPTNGQAFQFLVDTDAASPAFAGTFSHLTGGFALVNYANDGATVTVYDSFTNIPGLADPADAPILTAFGVSGPDSPTAAPLLDKLAAGDLAGARAVIKSAKPTGLASLTAMSIDSSSRNADFLRSRENTARAAAATPDAPRTWEAYATVGSTMSASAGGADAPGFDHTVNGGKVGLDYGTSTVVGLVAGYDIGSATLLNSGGKSGMNRASLMAYCSQTFAGAGFVQFGLGGGFSSYDTKRNTALGTLKGDTSGTDLDAAAGIGYTVKAGDTVSITPYAELTYVSSTVSGFTESGNALALKVSDYTQNSLRAKAGADFGFVITPAFRLSLDLSLSQELMDTDVDIPASFVSGGNRFTTKAPSTPSTILAVGPKLRYEFGSGMSVSAGYNYELGFDSTTAHRFEAAFTKRF